MAKCPQLARQLKAKAMKSMYVISVVLLVYVLVLMVACYDVWRIVAT